MNTVTQREYDKASIAWFKQKHSLRSLFAFSPAAYYKQQEEGKIKTYGQHMCDELRLDEKIKDKEWLAKLKAADLHQVDAARMLRTLVNASD